ncbi:MAG: hypothetical protein AAGJ35_02660 [Myxococcota bacterium]
MRPYIPNSVWIKSTALLALIAWLLLTLIAEKQSLELQHQSWKRVKSDLYYLPSPTALKLSSLGYRTTLADLIWIRALLYAGEHFSQDQGSIHWLPLYFEAIRHLNPKHRYLYEWAATLNIYNLRKTSRKEMNESLRVLRLGAQEFPDDHYFPYAIAMAYIFEIKLGNRSIRQLKADHLSFCKKPAPALTGSPAQRKIALIRKTRACMRQIGGKFLMEAATKPNAPPYLGTQAAGVLKRGGTQRKLICGYLMDILWRTNNEEGLQRIRQRLRRQCKSVRSPQSLCREKQFTQNWKKKFPYLPRALYGHIAPSRPSRQYHPFSILDPLISPCETKPTSFQPKH